MVLSFFAWQVAIKHHKLMTKIEKFLHFIQNIIGSNVWKIFFCLWYCSWQPEWCFTQVLQPNPVPLRFAPFTPMQQWRHLPNLRCANSMRLTESCSLPWKGVGGSAGGGPGWRRQEKFPINFWMTPDINLSCSSGFGGFLMLACS